MTEIWGMLNEYKSFGLTCELPEDAPELGDVGGEGDVGVQHDDLPQVGRQSFGERKFHQAVNS